MWYMRDFEVEAIVIELLLNIRSRNKSEKDEEDKIN